MIAIGKRVKSRYGPEGIVVGYGTLEWPNSVPGMHDEATHPNEPVPVYLVKVAEGQNSLTGPGCAVFSMGSTEEVNVTTPLPSEITAWRHQEKIQALRDYRARTGATLHEAILQLEAMTGIPLRKDGNFAERPNGGAWA